MIDELGLGGRAEFCRTIPYKAQLIPRPPHERLNTSSLRPPSRISAQGACGRWQKLLERNGQEIGIRNMKE